MSYFVAVNMGTWGGSWWFGLENRRMTDPSAGESALVMPAGNTSKANGKNYSAGCQIFTCDHKQFYSGGGGWRGGGWGGIRKQGDSCLMGFSLEPQQPLILLQIGSNSLLLIPFSNFFIINTDHSQDMLLITSWQTERETSQAIEL